MSGRDDLPPHPDQDPTETVAWVVAIQLQHVIKTQELLVAKIDKVERDVADLKREQRRMSGGESATTKSVSRRVSGTASSTGTRSKAKATEVDVDPKQTEAIDALKQSYLAELTQTFEGFIQQPNVKIYVKRTPDAEPVASRYVEFIVNRLRAIDEKHPAIPSLKRLNSDLEVELYLFLGRLHKQEKQDSAVDKKRTKASHKADREFQAKEKEVAEARSQSSASQKSRDGLASNETTPRPKKRAAAPIRSTRPSRRARFIVEDSEDGEKHVAGEDEEDIEL